MAESGLENHIFCLEFDLNSSDTMRARLDSKADYWFVGHGNCFGFNCSALGVVPAIRDSLAGRVFSLYSCRFVVEASKWSDLNPCHLQAAAASLE